MATLFFTSNMSMLPSFPSLHLATAFCFTPKQASKKGQSHDLNNLAASSDWADMNKLASIHASQKVVLSTDASLKKWVRTFKNVGKTEKSGAAAIYALQVATWRPVKLKKYTKRSTSWSAQTKP